MRPSTGGRAPTTRPLSRPADGWKDAHEAEASLRGVKRAREEDECSEPELE